MRDGLYVQYGCGLDAPAGWLNFDASPTLRVERFPLIGSHLSAVFKRNVAPFPANVRYGDILKSLPVSDKSCIGIYCSHVLEHLALEDFRKAVLNTKLLLKPDGVFRFVVPDLTFYIRQYCENTTPESAPQFMRATGLGELTRNRGFKGILQEILGNSRHRWMWDYPSLERELRQAGFARVRQAAIGDSIDSMFTRVEREERWINCLGIECKLK